MTEDDRALVARAQDGDRSAFEALVSRHGRRIFALVLRMVRGDREEAEDLTQEVLLRAWQALPRFRGESGFATWLYRIAVNRTLHRLEKRRLAVEPLEDGMASAGPDPSAVAGGAELARALQQALDRLPAASRTVFLLRQTQGLSHDEIAEVLGSNAQAVRVRLHRARKDLERWLAPWLEAR